MLCIDYPRGVKRAVLLLAVLAALVGAAVLAMRAGVIPMPEFLSDGDGQREGDVPDFVEPDEATDDEGDGDGELRAAPRPNLRPVESTTGPASDQPAAEVVKSSAASLRGVVVGQDGRAIANATVSLLQGKVAAEGTTDAEGRFRLDAVPGRYDVRIVAGGDGVLMMDDVIVDGRGLEGTFRLSPAAKLEVFVTIDGRAVAGLPVIVSASDDPVSSRVFAQAATDGRGAVSFPELAAGDVFVRAYEGSSSYARKRVTLRGGAEERVELAFPAHVTWTGVVRDAATNAGLQASIQLDVDGPDGLRYRAQGNADPSGVFSLSLPQGRPVMLSVRDGGHAPYPSAKEASAALAAIAGLRNGSLTHDLALRRGAIVSGTVTGPNGLGVEGLMLEFRPERGTSAMTVTVGSGGWYALDGLAAGTHRVSIPSPGWYPKSGPLQVRVPEDGTQGPASVTYDFDVLLAGVVSGSVSLADGSPATAARVWLVGGRGAVRGARNTGRFLETFTAQDGTFSIDDVPPVEGVRVRATWGDAEALPSDVLSTAAGGPPPVRLVLSATVRLVGRVTDLRTGAPIAGANVNVDPMGEPPSRGRGNAVTDADGRYELTNRIPGRWRVAANRKRDYLPGEPREFDLVAGTSPFTADLVLDPGLPIAGLVTNEAGEALAGARLTLTGAEDGAAPGATVSRNANTGADGAFRWTALRTGRYTLVLSRKGFATLSVPLRAGEDRLRLLMAVAPGKN